MMGPHGQRAILDVAKADVIAYDDTMSGTWGAFLRGLTRDAGCKMQLIPDEAGENTNLDPD